MTVSGNPPPPEAAVRAVLDTSSQWTRRIEIYEYDNETLWNAGGVPRIIDGNISVDYSRDERRTLDLVLDNSDGALRHDPFDGFWYDKIIRLYRGIRYWTIDEITGKAVQDEYEACVGVFMIDRIDAQYFPHTISVTGRDFTKKMLTSKLERSMQFPAGTAVEDVLAAVAANAGIFGVILPNTGLTVDSTTVFERGTARWAVCKQVANAANHELFFNGTGYLVMRPYRDPTTSPIEYTFQTGPLVGNLISYGKSSNDARVFNHIVVAGDDEINSDSNGTSTNLVFAEYRNENPDSPTRIERIGDRYTSYQSSLFDTQEKADNFAQSQLSILALEEFNIDFDSLVVPWMEAGTIVEILVPGNTPYEPTRFLLDTIKIPLKLGPMSGTGRRVTIVGSKNN